MFDFIFGAPSPEQQLHDAVAEKKFETAVRLLESAGTPCQRLDLANKINERGDNVTAGLARHLDGTETITLSYFRDGLVASFDQKQCLRATDQTGK